MKFIRKHLIELGIIIAFYIISIALSVYMVIIGMPILMLLFMVGFPTTIIIEYIILQNKSDKYIEKHNVVKDRYLASIKIMDSTPSNCGTPFDFNEVMRVLENSGMNIKCDFSHYITD